MGQALASAKSGDGTILAAFAYALNGLDPGGSVSNIVSANAATMNSEFVRWSATMRTGSAPGAPSNTAFKRAASSLGRSTRASEPPTLVG